KVGVEQFKNDMGFLPPMIKDFNPAYDTAAVPSQPSPPIGYARTPIYTANDEYGVNSFSFSLAARNAADRDYLRGETLDATALGTGTDDLRFSEYSLAWYLAGALATTYEQDSQTLPVDGFAGPTMGKVTRGGAFETGRGSFGPYFDVGNSADVISQPSAAELAEGRVSLRSRSGPAFRYYRWLPGRTGETRVLFDSGQELTQLNVPALVGDPSANPQLRNAEYAIVSAGADGGFGDLGTENEEALAIEIGAQGKTGEALATAARADNIVEVGQ
ncbi:MAG: hypothetical protein AAFY58_06595, partial [Planctomycetota bacterium]